MVMKCIHVNRKWIVIRDKIQRAEKRESVKIKRILRICSVCIMRLYNVKGTIDGTFRVSQGECDEWFTRLTSIKIISRAYGYNLICGWTGLISTNAVSRVKVHVLRDVKSQRASRGLLKKCIASPTHQGFCTLYFRSQNMNSGKLYVAECEFKCFTFSARIHTRKLRHWRRRILFRPTFPPSLACETSSSDVQHTHTHTWV